MEYLAENYYLLIAVVGIMVVALAFYLPRKRRKDLEELAGSMGLSFSPQGPHTAGVGLEFFYAGHSSSAVNLIQVRVSNFNINFFDYSYVTGSGKHRNTHNFTLALIECPKAQVPKFDLKPETFLHKLGELVGFKDIDLPAFPLFSEKYRLTAPEEAAAHMFFTPRRAAWFEQNPGLRVQGTPGWVLFFRKEGRLRVDAWQPFMEEVKTFAAEVLGS